MQDSNESEADQSIETGTKPVNRQTVGEMLWSIQREAYKDAFPDSITAAVFESGAKAFPGMGAVAGMMEGPTTLEESIKEAKDRLERGKDYEGVPLTAEEIKGLNDIIDLEGKKGTDIYNTIYDGYDIHLGMTDKKLGFIRNIGVPDLKTKTRTDTISERFLSDPNITKSLTTEFASDATETAADTTEKGKVAREERVKELMKPYEDENFDPTGGMPDKETAKGQAQGKRLYRGIWI